MLQLAEEVRLLTAFSVLTGAEHAVLQRRVGVFLLLAGDQWESLISGGGSTPGPPSLMNEIRDSNRNEAHALFSLLLFPQSFIRSFSKWRP